MAVEKVNNTVETTEEAPSSAINSNLNKASILDRIGDFLTLRGKIIGAVVGGVALIFLGWYGYQKWFVQPENVRTAGNIYQPESHLVDDQNWDMAIKGDTAMGTYAGFEALSKQFDGYDGGNIATYDLGVAYLNSGDAANALKAFQNVDFDDENLATMTLGAMGDASMNLGKYEDAVDYYTQAYNRRPKNEMSAPLYMMKLANTYELQGKYGEAEKMYKDLIANFPFSSLRTKAEKNLVFVEAGTSIYEIK
ncbi:MAG: tetratricopeptide repeat protein [Flavobacteriales bacterium]|nr:tetratricopeptide repeat protein [Flavobacteriales bacterium]MCB9198019.1 tetratricopeptide repeat protein [Flavobacteriales bacterium]